MLTGALEVDGRVLTPGHLGYLGPGRTELGLGVRAPTRAVLLWGVPFESQVVIWWNFVGRSRDEMVAAYRHWADDDGWFGPVASSLPLIGVDAPPWRLRATPHDDC